MLTETNVQVNLTGLGELIEVGEMVQNMEGAVQTMKTEFVKSLSLRSAGKLREEYIQYVLILYLLFINKIFYLDFCPYHF